MYLCDDSEQEKSENILNTKTILKQRKSAADDMFHFVMCAMRF